MKSWWRTGKRKYSVCSAHISPFGGIKVTIMNHGFGKQQSQIIKGVAIILMAFHHCFIPVKGNLDGYSITFFPFTYAQVTEFAAFSKICVSLFSFVSGYGLFLSFRNRLDSKGRNSVSHWLRQRYIRSFSGYWLIVVLSWIISGFIDARPLKVYVQNSRLAGGVYALIDFLGLGNLFGTPMLNGTWWYMSAAFVFIMLVPALFLMLCRFGNACTFAVLIIIPRLFSKYPGALSPLSFLPVLCLGMICARTDFFGRIDALNARGIPSRLLLTLGSTALCVVLYRIACRLPDETCWDIKWDIFPLAYIVCIYLTLARIPWVDRFLAFMGKHSANIFLVHTFYRVIYTKSFVYERGHFLSVIAVLMVMSLGTSFVIEGLKKLIRYERFTSGLEKLSFPFISKKPDC